MAEPRRRVLEVRIGAFILAGLGVFLAIVYLLGAQARYFERKYDLYAEFVEVGGLIAYRTIADVYRKVVETVPADLRLADRPVYFSRTRLPVRRVAGELNLEIGLQERGWRIVHPETIPFVEQLQIVRSAKVF